MDTNTKQIIENFVCTHRHRYKTVYRDADHGYAWANIGPWIQVGCDKGALALTHNRQVENSNVVDRVVNALLGRSCWT